jgi:DNA-binding response OmpR family regulator
VEPPLSVAQFTLLNLLYQSPGEVVTRAQIIAAVWPNADPAGVSEEAVDGLIKRLRARIRETQVNAEREYIEVLRGHGVRLVQSEE